MFARSTVGVFLGLILCFPPTTRAEEMKVLELRVQKQGDSIYFHVRLEPPSDLQPNINQTNRLTWSNTLRTPALRQARLVPQDGKTTVVYRRGGEEWLRNMRATGLPTAPAAPRGGTPQAPVNAGPVPVQGLEFVGKVKGMEKAQFLLLYPYVEETKIPQDAGKTTRTLRKHLWKEMPLSLDLAGAIQVDVPSTAAQRQPSTWPGRNDLEGLWAVAQAEQYLAWESVTTGFGFYSFARLANSRKYGVPTLGEEQEGRTNFRDSDFLDSHLYEMTTGAAALAESLALRRMLGHGQQTEERTVALSSVPGIDIAEHPWEKMMAGKKPSDEPLARFIPHDQYYLRFKTFRSYLAASDLSEEWGTAISQAYELKSREYQLKERYEKQLCLRSTLLGRTLGPTVIRSMAFTGGDLYFREGTDVTVLFDVANTQLFRAAVEPFLTAARKEFGPRLQVSKTEYQGVSLESYVTPQREVSLHRATLGNVVVYANSAMALRRIIDTHGKRHKALADSLDFQYMRTIFRADDPEEDSFAFFSDAFIRQLVGPASKIKERRRIEAYTSLQMLHHAAIYAALEYGSIPGDLAALMSASKLTGKELLLPEGPPVEWRGESKLAFSTAYNTIHFLTPLCELPIDKVTPREQREYEQFRQQYLGLWRQYFDPVGMRLAQKNGKLQLDTYILPLIQSSEYNQLRQWTGDGTTTLDLRQIPATTVFQFMSHISPRAPERQFLAQGLRSVTGRELAADWLGNWFLVRFDDSEVYAQLAKLTMQRYLEGDDLGRDWNQELALIFQMPVTVGVEIKNSLIFAGLLTALRSSLMNALPDAVTWETLDPKYKNVSIVRIQAQPNGPLAEFTQQARPALYYALVDGGWYVSFREECIKGVIDRAMVRREKKGDKPDPSQLVELNSGMYLSPEAAKAAMQVANLWLAYQTHEHAVENTPLYQPLYLAGLLDKDAPAAVQHRLAFQHFGFIPVSPDGTAYRFDPQRQEVTNTVHGSLRHAKMPEKLAVELPLQKMLAEVVNFRLDLRFREDGIHTVLTLNRQPKGK